MRILKLTTYCVLGVVLLFAVSVAQAAPVPYSINFDGSGVGGPGTGSFFWDDTSQLISNLTWDFGGGDAGGVNDAVIDWTVDVIGGTKAQWTFEILTMQDVHPEPCTELGSGCESGFVPGNGLFGFAGQQASFGLASNNIQYYLFRDSSQTVESGNFSTSMAPVPEPTTMLLLATGLIGLAGFRRKFKK